MKRMILSTAAALVPLLPIALAAQAAPQQQSANPVTQAFKQSSDLYARWLTAAFDSIPESKYGYKPTPAQLSIAYIAQHLESANYQLCARFSSATWPMTAKDSLADTVKAKWPKDTLSARLKASFKFCDDAIDKVTDPMLSEQIPVGAPGSGRTALRARYVLGYVTDLADHWSQIANYMRLNGMTPPSALPRPAAR
jgi:hypothetical protein